MNLFQIAVEASELCDNTYIGQVVSAVKSIISVIGFVVPIILIILGTIDMFKAMTTGDEKKAKEARTAFIKRVIYAIVIFLVPFIVQFVFSFLATVISGNEVADANNTVKAFFKCYGNGGKKNDASDDGVVVYGTCIFSNGREAMTNVTEYSCQTMDYVKRWEPNK